jgi:hypothetical protein
MGFFEFLFGSFVGVIVFLILLSLYFLPTIIALLRRQPNALAIFLLNFFLGWSFIGWVVALVWSVTK